MTSDARQAELDDWATAARILADHGKAAGDVAFKAICSAVGYDAQRQWLSVLDKMEELEGLDRALH